jgi:predicted aspartyl protease
VKQPINIGSKKVSNNIHKMNDREFLLTEEQEEGRSQYDECPEIICNICDLPVRALIDTGSEVTCVSSKFIENNKQLHNCPRLPVKNCNVQGATGAKMQKITEQIYLPININGTQTQIVALIVPKLIHECIIGVDTLMDCKTEINFKENIIKMEINTTKIIVYIKEFKHWKSVNIIKRYGEKPVVNDKSDHHGMDETPEINIGTELENEQQNQIQQLVYEYRDAFRTEPGRAKYYENQLKLTENASFVQRTYTQNERNRPRDRDCFSSPLSLYTIERKWKKRSNRC